MSRTWTLRVFVGLVVLAAVASLYALPSRGAFASPATLLLLSVMTAVAGSRPVRISALRVQLTVTHPFIFCALGALGGFAAVLVTLCGVIGSMVIKRSGSVPIRVAFNISAQAASTAAAGIVFHLLGGRPGSTTVALLLPLAGATATFFLVNTGLVSVAVGLERAQRIFQTWRDSFLWTVVSYMTGLTVAAVMLLVLESLGLWGLALAIPPCWMLLAFYKTHKDRLEEHQRRIQEVEGLNAELEHKVALRTHELEEALQRIEETNRELRDTNVQLTKAGRAKSEFLANVSHELRTPLNSVIGFSELLEDRSSGVLTERQRELVGDIKESGEHLLSLINDILDLSKIEAAKMELHRVPVELEGLLRGCVAMIRPQADKKRLTVTTRCGEDVRVAELDPGMFRSVLVNLLSNAVKFTPEGGSIRVNAIREGRGVWVEVQDSGIGISEEDQERVFRQFYQVDSSYSREYQGTGLGLALVMRMVELHGGTVRLESKRGEGALFRCSFPDCLVEGPATELPRTGDASAARPLPVSFGVAEPGGAPSSAGAPGAAPSAGQAATAGTGRPRERTILLVEDNVLNRKLARNALKSRGHRVIEAETGEDALDRVREQRPDLILMDLLLPGIDGLEVTRRLKRDPSTAAITVVALTAHTETIDEQRALDAGCAGYIAKPIQLARFPDQIEGFFETKENVA